MKLVSPSMMPKLGKAGSLQSRQAIIHSLAHTESWAIDLSWVSFVLIATTCNVFVIMSNTSPAQPFACVLPFSIPGYYCSIWAAGGDA